MGATKKVVKKKVAEPIVTNDEIDQEIRTLNEGQLKVNAKLAAEQLGELQGGMRKETGKYVRPGLRAMRAEEETVNSHNLPPVSVMLSIKVKGAE